MSAFALQLLRYELVVVRLLQSRRSFYYNNLVVLGFFFSWHIDSPALFFLNRLVIHHRALLTLNQRSLSNKYKHYISLFRLHHLSWLLNPLILSHVPFLNIKGRQKVIGRTFSLTHSGGPIRLFLLLLCQGPHEPHIIVAMRWGVWWTLAKESKE